MSDLTDFYSELGSKQRDQRVRRYFTDQFGRRYFAWADKDNQRPIGEFVLADNTGKFETAPWTPPMGQIEWPDPDGLEFRWKFDSLASELAGNTAEWYSYAQQIAQSAHLPIPDVGGDVHPTLVGLMGPPPLSPEIPLACDAGEPWLLGRKGAPVNLHLQRILNLGRQITSTYALEAIKARVLRMVENGETDLSTLNVAGVPAESIEDVNLLAMSYGEFMKECRKKGMSMGETVDAWRAHKEFVAAEKAEMASV